MSFYGSQMQTTDLPQLVALAEKLGMPQLRMVSTPITPDIKLAPADTRLLLEYVAGRCWRAEFDENLQCLAETVAGEALLTGWMSVDQFATFVRDAGHDDPVRRVLNVLAANTSHWKGLGVSEVTFDGYRLE
jgi:hypothetical protein